MHGAQLVFSLEKVLQSDEAWRTSVAHGIECLTDKSWMTVVAKKKYI